ncbi:hypothetical protein V8C42DRAFT_306836 [Trichoderma barbatum]
MFWLFVKPHTNALLLWAALADDVLLPRKEPVLRGRRHMPWRKSFPFEDCPIVCLEILQGEKSRDLRTGSLPLTLHEE